MPSTAGRSSTAPRVRAPTPPSGRRPTSPDDDLLRAHVERFNEGVRSGNFIPMLDGFAEDAELAFEGVPVGPFRGKEAIGRAYAEQPPDDEIEILRTREQGAELIVADYAWKADPKARAGTMILRLRDGRIDRLVVTFD